MTSYARADNRFRRSLTALLVGQVLLGGCRADPSSPEGAADPETEESDTPSPPEETDTDPEMVEETDVDPPIYPVPTLDGVSFDPSAGETLSGCLPLVYGSDRTDALPVAAADLDGDGVVEVVLFNQRCPDAGGNGVDQPILHFDVVSQRLVVVSALGERLSTGGIFRSVSAATFVDVERDGDADLVGNVAMSPNPDSVVPVWLNDGSGHFSPVDLVWTEPGASFANVSPIGVSDADGDGQVEVVSVIRHEDPSGTDVRLAMTRRGPGLGWTVDVGWTEPATGLESWALLPFSLRPSDEPWAWVFATANALAAQDDFVWRTADGASMGSTFADVATDPRTGGAVDALAFLRPECASRSLACLTPMGGSGVRLAFDETSGRSWRDCVMISTGWTAWPVGVFCDDGTGQAMVESGSVSAAMEVSGADVPGDVVHLAWQVSATWDVNADGWSDVIVANGRDALPWEVMPSYAFLQTPGCFSDACARYARAEFPMPAGHRHGLLWFPVQAPDGSFRLLAIMSSDSAPSPQESDLLAFTWGVVPDGGRRWFSLQIGARHDLRAIGTVVHSSFEDAAGAPVAGSEQTLVSLASTWGQPGANDPVVLGVPVGAVVARVRMELPGCRPEVRLDIAEFDRPYEVEIPDCP